MGREDGGCFRAAFCRLNRNHENEEVEIMALHVTLHMINPSSILF